MSEKIKKKKKVTKKLNFHQHFTLAYIFLKVFEIIMHHIDQYS